MSRPRSATWPLALAIVAAVEGDATTSALLATPGIYNTEAPAGAPFDYLTLDIPTEGPDVTFSGFNEQGTTGSQQISIWCKTGGSLGNQKVLAIYDALYGLLNDQPLAVTGFAQLTGTLALIGVLPDPDGVTMHGICRYDVTHRQTT